MAGFSCGGGRGGRPAGTGSVAMGVWALLGLGEAEGAAVVITVRFSPAGAVELEGERLSKRA